MTKEQALDLARRTAEGEGWPFLDPTSVKFQKGWFGRPGHWFIETGINTRGGCTVNITINDRTGTVVYKEFFNFPR